MLICAIGKLSCNLRGAEVNPEPKVERTWQNQEAANHFYFAPNIQKFWSMLGCLPATFSEPNEELSLYQSAFSEHYSIRLSPTLFIQVLNQFIRSGFSTRCYFLAFSSASGFDSVVSDSKSLACKAKRACVAWLIFKARRSRAERTA